MAEGKCIQRGNEVVSPATKDGEDAPRKCSEGKSYAVKCCSDTYKRAQTICIVDESITGKILREVYH